VLNIVLPVAGRGSRFSDAGYAIPKPLIPIYGKPMIQWVVENLRPTRPHRFVFVALKEHLDCFGLQEVLVRVAPGSSVVPVTEVTQGAACTVLLAKQYIDSGSPLMIANTDQYVDMRVDDYLEAFDGSRADGYIMTFTANHPKWSYVRFDGSGAVCEVVEKRVVSSEATVGVYNYRRGSDFVRAAEAMIVDDKRVNGEFYVAPAYNELLKSGGKVGVFNIDSLGTGMHGLGTPEDLDAFLAVPLSRTHAPDRTRP
jgi:dTDP-glucose pyrophosphorylase